MSRSIIFALLLSVVLVSCKDSTGPDTNGSSSDTARLVATKTGSDTLYGSPNSTVSVTFTVTRSGKPVDSSIISYLHPITGSSLLSDPTVSGKTTITIDIPATTTAGVYPVDFIAGKRDVVMSDTIHMYVRVDGRATTKLSLRARGEASGIGLSWTRASSDHGADTAYIATSDGAVVNKQIIAAPQSDAHFGGLTEGVVYTLYVNTSDAFSERINWALSKRYGPIRVMEGQGVVLATGAVADANSPSASSLDIDLATDAASPGLISLASASVTSLTGIPNGRSTHLSDFYVYGQSVDSIYFQKDLSTKFDSDVTTIELDLQVHPSLIFQAITADGHYAQIGVISQPDGKLIGVTPDQKRFVDLRVSYQPVANVPYAGRAQPTLSVRRTARAR